MLFRSIHDVLRESSALNSNHAPVEIIPCCVDLEPYRAAAGDAVRRRLGLEDRLVLAYAGSLGGWYMAEEMVALFCELCRLFPRAHFLVLTQSPFALIQRCFQAAGVSSDRCTVLTVEPEQVPSYLAAADLAVSFIKPCFSKLSSSPTKVGEYLAAGLPFIANPGIGDQDELLREEKVGVLVEAFDPAAYRQALTRLLEMLADRTRVQARCRQVAADRYCLERVGREGYRRVYSRLGWTPRA